MRRFLALLLVLMVFGMIASVSALMIVKPKNLVGIEVGCKPKDPSFIHSPKPVNSSNPMKTGFIHNPKDPSLFMTPNKNKGSVMNPKDYAKLICEFKTN